MNSLYVTIKLLQPLLVAAPAAGEENSAVSLDYIPGSVLRGALIERFRQRKKVTTELLRDPVAKRLFFSEEVRYLNAYLGDAKGVRGLPTPASWVTEKGQEDDASGAIYDLALQDGAELKDPKGLKKPFCWLAVDDEDEFNPRVIATVNKPKRQPQLHNASDTRFVKREDDSTLFRYDALAAGQRFEAVILCADSALTAELSALLAPAEFSLGRSRSAGYGRIVIERVKEAPVRNEFEPMPAANDQAIVLTLLSDAILRQPETGAYTTDLPSALGINQKMQKAFVASDVTGGFNRAWGMPMPQAPMLCAGSVWVFEHRVELIDKLTTLIKTGIGERRNEGFGRIAVNWQGIAQLKQEEAYTSLALKPAVVLESANATLAQTMVNRLYRQALEEKLLALATGNLEIQGKLEKAQLSRLRTLVGQAAQTQQPQMVLEFLKTLRDTARTQFRRARLGGKPLLRWLEEGWKDGGLKEGGLWATYFYIAPDKRPKLGAVVAQDDASLRLEYMARLVDVVCKRAIQKQQAEEQKVRAA